MMIQDESDLKFMKLALQEAAIALEENQIPVGAVIVNENNELISKARNQVNILNSTIAHAEMLAIIKAQEYLFKNKGKCTLYTTLEPCMMCLGAIVYAQFSRLVIAALAPSVGGLRMLDTVQHYRDNSPEIITGVLEHESKELIRQYVSKTGLRHDLLT
ncbi:MAG: nucleoside deaminase [Clostridiales bacterium]|nr:nucleoside deaminase [Clostridiales bacterium]